MTKKNDEQISHLIDGRLSAQSARLLRARIDEDPELYERYQALKSAKEVVRADAGIAKLPQGFDARLRKRLRSEELRERAQARAASEVPRNLLARKAALAMTGVAAGIALALVIGPKVGIHLLPERQNDIAATNIQDHTLPPPSIGVDYLEPFVLARLTAARELESQILGVGEELDPSWLEAEMRLGGLLDDTSELENALEATFGTRARELEEDYRAWRKSADALHTLVQQGHRQGQRLHRDALLPLLATIRDHSVKAKRNSKELEPSFAQSDPELNAYLAARQLFKNGHFEGARQAFADFRHDWPDTEYHRLAVLWMARSQMRSGHGRDAVELLESATINDSKLLGMLNQNDLEVLEDACGLTGKNYLVAGGIGEPIVPKNSNSHLLDFGKFEAHIFSALERRWKAHQAKNR